MAIPGDGTNDIFIRVDPGPSPSPEPTQEELQQVASQQIGAGAIAASVSDLAAGGGTKSLSYTESVLAADTVSGEFGSAGDDYYYSKIAAWLVVYPDDGFPLYFDISSVNMRYAVNQIPVATNISISTGINARTQQASPSLQIGSLRQYQEMEIRFAVASSAIDAAPGGVKWDDSMIVDDANWPPQLIDGITIFKGFISSITYSSERGLRGSKASYSLSCVGWLHDLQGTTVSARTFSRLNSFTPTEYYNLVLSRASKSTGKESKSGSNPLRAFVAKYGGEVESNLWKEAVRPMLFELSDVISSSGGVEPATQLLSEDTKSNINGNTESIVNPSWMSPDGSDEMNLSEYSNGLTTGLGNEILKIVFGNWWAGDVWRSMLGLSQSFYSAVIPTVEAYAFVPYIPQLGGTDVFRTLYADEYDVIQVSGQAQRLLRRIVLGGYTAIRTDAAWAKGTTKKPSEPIGVWPPVSDAELSGGGSDEDTRLYVGETRFENLPGWISQFCQAYSLEGKQCFDGGGDKPPKDEHGDVDKDEGPKKGKTQHEVSNDIKESGIGDRIARAIYCQQLFAARRISVSGRLRFDVGPGSLINLKGVGEKIGSSTENDELYAHVDAVDIILNISNDSGVARTSFTLSHVRTSAEQQNTETYCPETHPIYDVRWKGCPLIKNPGTVREVSTQE